MMSTQSGRYGVGTQLSVSVQNKIGHNNKYGGIKNAFKQINILDADLQRKQINDTKHILCTYG